MKCGVLKVVKGRGRDGGAHTNVYVDGKRIEAVYSVDVFELKDGGYHAYVVPFADTPILQLDVAKLVREETSEVLPP